MDAGTDSPLLGLLFQAFFCFSVWKNFCPLLSQYPQFNRWCKEMEDDQFSPPCSCSTPYLCNEMNSLNTKLSFLANEQDSIPPWHRVSAIHFFALRNLWVQRKMNPAFALQLPHPASLASGLSAFNRKKKGWRHVLLTFAVLRATEKEWK